ncbi:hypothetical protein SISNIDRAFT_491242 [Sistotremastrum niveocremeum HHB9708]|uniref:Uncharacterized protein n=1 Tax=Sistotremastrum niveocremeum HHB9708 TaxID=1314777 RepID=A0A164N2C7_9AGAM|nr:hypothetical protein SISNIDRAFT_491242 [Sistotremastrum niveocremeum HHB9708]
MPTFNHLSNHSHRRAVTALVVPHPSRTPGLLSIQTTPKQSPPRPHPSKQARNNHLQRRERHEPASASPSPQQQVPAVDDVFSSSTSSEPIINPRGRTPNNTHSNKRAAPRSSSRPTPSSDLAHPPPPSVAPSDKPFLTSQPSGRLAKSRRQRNNFKSAAPPPSPDSRPASPTPAGPVASVAAAPISVPKSKKVQNVNNNAHLTMSRSAPTLTHPNMATRSQKRQKEKRPKNHSAPVSGMEEATDVSLDLEDLPLSDWDMAPSPLATRRPAANNAATWSPAHARPQSPLRTAPISVGPEPGVFPFPTSNSTPSPPRRHRSAHIRSPSFPLESLFSSVNLDGKSSGSFPLSEVAPPEDEATKLANMQSAFYRRYANSEFQNSPSPRELPKPKFLAGASIPAASDIFGPF